MKLSRLLLLLLMTAVFLGATVKVKGGLHGTPDEWSVELEASTTYEPGNVQSAKKTWRIARPFFTADKFSRIRRVVTNHEAREVVSEVFEQLAQVAGQALVDSLPNPDDPGAGDKKPEAKKTASR